MRLGLLLIAAATAAGLSAATFAACLTTRPMPPGGAAPTLPSADAASFAPDGPEPASPCDEAPGQPSAHASADGPDAAAGPSATGPAVSPQCEAPTVAVTGPPRTGVVFNNAMTSADAGYVDRTALVLQALDEQTPKLRCCLEPWGAAAGPAQGALRLVVELDAAGRVSRAEVDVMRSSPLPAGVADCISSVIRATSFPRSPADRTTLVEYPLALTRSAT